jgi:hypothetical protein
MQRNRQLNYPKSRAKMPSRDGYGINGFVTYLCGKLLELFDRKFPYIGGIINLIQKRCIRNNFYLSFSTFMLPGNNTL